MTRDKTFTQLYRNGQNWLTQLNPVYRPIPILSISLFPTYFITALINEMGADDGRNNEVIYGANHF